MPAMIGVAFTGPPHGGAARRPERPVGGRRRTSELREGEVPEGRADRERVVQCVPRRGPRRQLAKVAVVGDLGLLVLDLRLVVHHWDLLQLLDTWNRRRTPTGEQGRKKEEIRGGAQERRGADRTVLPGRRLRGASRREPDRTRLELHRIRLLGVGARARDLAPAGGISPDDLRRGSAAVRRRPRLRL